MKATLVVLFAGAIVGCGEGADEEEPGARCGDGISPFVDVSNCDDGNTADGDGCSATCAQEPGWECDTADQQVADVCTPRCGDTTLVGPEVCDTTLDPYCQDCAAIVGSCGDGVLQSHEGCDVAGAVVAECTNCQPRFGYVCSGQPSTCGQSGLAPDLLLESMNGLEGSAFCEWNIAVLGGANHTNTCGAVEYRTYDLAQCLQHLVEADYGACTIADWESRMAAFTDACSYLNAVNVTGLACSSQ
jgi:cysteine-rich repeat protein